MSGVSRRARKQNATGETRLHVAARLNNVRDVVILLLDGAHVDATDYAGLELLRPRHGAAEYCDERVCVCVSVCLRAHLGNYTPDLHHIFVHMMMMMMMMLPMAVARSSSGGRPIVIRYVFPVYG